MPLDGDFKPNNSRNGCVGNAPKNLENQPLTRRNSKIGKILEGANFLKRITKEIASPITNALVGEMKKDETKLKPRTNEFIQYKSSQDTFVYYRMGIIDFL